MRQLLGNSPGGTYRWKLENVVCYFRKILSFQCTIRLQRGDRPGAFKTARAGFGRYATDHLLERRFSRLSLVRHDWQTLDDGYLKQRSACEYVAQHSDL